MLKFTEYVNGPMLMEQASPAELGHFQHIEDMMLHSGEAGYHQSAGALQAISDKLNGKFNTTKLFTTYHSNMPVVFGHHPESGKFFVATKDNYDKKLNYTPDDADKYHRSEPEVAGVMKTALQHLSKVTPKKGVYHGDVLNYETNEENPKKSKMSLVVNSRSGYMHESTNTWGFEANAHQFKKDAHVNIISPETEIGVQSGGSGLKFTHHMTAANNAFMTRHPDMFPTIGLHSRQIKKYVTRAVREGEPISAPGYIKHLVNTGDQDAGDTESAVKKKMIHADVNRQVNYATDNSQHFEKAFKLHSHLQKAKDALLDSLKNGVDEDGIGKPKGFVVVHNGSPMKLIDRKKVE